MNQKERKNHTHFFFIINIETPLSVEIRCEDNDVLKDHSEHAAW